MAGNGNSGRIPEPTQLRVLKGNPGKRALPKNEPKPGRASGEPPVWLSPGRPRELWSYFFGKLDKMRIMSDADEVALAMLCDQLDEYISCRGIVKAKGRWLAVKDKKTGRITTQKMPEVAMANEAWANVIKLLDRFGLTPSMRAKVQTLGEESEGDPFSEWESLG